MALEAKRRQLTTYNDIQVGGVAVAYDSDSGQVLIKGEPLDGHLLLELAARVGVARQREGHGAKPGLGSSSSGFIAVRLEGEALLAKQLELMWENLPLYYPEAKRGKVQERTPMARGLIEDE